MMALLPLARGRDAAARRTVIEKTAQFLGETTPLRVGERVGRDKAEPLA